MTQASCRPGRLTRFEEAHHAACDGLVRRAGALDDALATYRATCAGEYRAGTVDAVAAIDDWRGSYRAFSTWVGDVGRAFLTADAIDAYVGTGGVPGDDGLSVHTEAEVLEHVHERWEDDPYLGVVDPSTGLVAIDAAPWVADLVADDQSQPPPWVEAVDSGAFATEVLGVMAGGAATLLAGIPRGVDVVVRYEGATLVVLRDGTVIARVTQAEAAARILVPRNTAGLEVASRWLGRASTAASFLAAGAGQWFGDEGLPTDERIYRAVVRGGGVALGGWLGGAGGGFLGGAAAGTVCGPGAPVCSSVLGVGGAIVGGVAGALGADWLVDRLPGMGNDEPLPLEYDLDAVTDLVGDGGPAEGTAPGIAVVDLAASEAVSASAEPGSWDEYFLQQVLPEADDLLAVIDPPPEAPPTGTTTTTTTTTTMPPPAPLPAPPPPAGPPTTDPQVPTGTTIPGG